MSRIFLLDASAHASMNDQIDYRVDAPLDDAALNGLFARSWPDHQLQRYEAVLARSLGTVTAYVGELLIGFVNLATDGGEHAFLLDPTVDAGYRRRGIGSHRVRRAVTLAKERGCKWLHVDYEPALAPFYQRLGFRASLAGVMRLDQADRPLTERIVAGS